MIIGLTGRKRSGKDSVATIIKNLQPDANSFSFAGPLKKAVSAVFGFEITDEHKEVPLTLWNASPRQLLQRTGDKLKELYPDIFVKSMESRITQCNQDITIIITDVRFNNEAEFVLSKGGFIIEINADKRLGKSSDTHCSEKGIDQKYVDYVVYNNDSYDDLSREVSRLLVEHEV